MIHATEKARQVSAQCNAVRTLCERIATVFYDYQTAMEAGAFEDDLLDIMGRRSARLMEELGDTLNGMDAVEDSDSLLDPIFAKAHEMFPIAAQTGAAEMDHRNPVPLAADRIDPDELNSPAVDPPQPAQEPVAWVRFCSDGTHEGLVMNASLEEVRKRSGAWTPLYATPSQKAAAGADARDAARWRYCEADAYEAVLPHGQKLGGRRTAWIMHFHAGETFREAIDAALHQQADPTADPETL